MQSRRQQGGQWCPPPHLKSMPPPFHVWPPGCYIHPILYFKNVVPPSGIGPSFCLLAPLLLNPGDGPEKMDGIKVVVVVLVQIFAQRFCTVIKNIMNKRLITSGIFADQPLRWFHILNWILHTVAFDIALAVTVIYWVFPGKPAMESAFSINSHALNFVFMFLDLFIINIPERLLHSVHSFNYTIVYTVFLLILHGSGAESKVYPVTDWARNPGLAAGLCVGAAFATILIRCVAYGLYKLREFIASKTMSTSSVADVVTQTGTFKATSDLGKDNLAYESNWKDEFLK